MTEPFSQPVLHVMRECPFCLKVRLFLLEAGLIDRVTVHEFAPGTEEERIIRQELASYFPKVSFPVVQFGDGEYLGESDDIIARFAAQADVEPANLPIFGAYAECILPRMMSLYRDNIELKKHFS